MKVLAIHAHPDDVEILAGGTAALLAARGHELTLSTMTPGDCGTADLGPEKISSIRRSEAAAAAKLIGAAYVCVELRDMAVFNDDASRRKVTEVVRQVRPELVLTASPVDYHPDHEAASSLVRDACFAAGCPNYITGTAAALDWIPHLYFMDPVEGVDRDRNLVRPDFLVNVGETFATKREMLACHASQREWLRRHHGMDDYLHTMEQWTRMRGQLLGVDFAEGFRRYHCHPYPQTALLEDLLA